MPGPIIIIPARLAANRLPGKPLADIGGAPMIVHVWRRAMEAAVAPVLVATDSDAIAEAIRTEGGKALLTRPDHVSGSDRIFEALQYIDGGGQFDVVVNLQGDLPLIPPAFLKAVLAPLDDSAVDIATLAAPIARPQERDDPNVVKVVGAPLSPSRLRALYFTRAAAPWGEGPHYHHLGVYAYRRAALERFVGLPPSPLEARERLEQLRALEAGLRIDVALIDDAVFGVDTPADLERARAILGQR
ncbi:MAG: 3-deoxy-manno-octulosonate cytidylyltransferase [Methylovirgula sp.]|jgi:3-deoxy-manno-octulosonate cytidylyltransferase (CMP-KDO synthetase)